MRKIKAIIYRWISERYMHGCSNYNTLAVRKGCRSKAQAREIFARNQVPHAAGMIFTLPHKVPSFINRHGFPVVVKPNVSGYSRGSYFPINSYADLWRGIFKAKAWWPTTVIEQYLSGTNYRVLCTGEELISVIRRYPPFVIGNGRDSINQLIDEENKIREQKKLYDAMFPISKSQAVVAHLKKQGLSLESVPDKDKHIELFHRVALAPGGIVEIISKHTIAAQNKELFLDVVRMFGANILGIDVIFENSITQSYKQQKCIFIEVNSRPYTKMHHYPRFGEAEDLTPYYDKLDKLAISDQDIF